MNQISSQTSKIPKLRFPGFHEEWKSAELGRVGEFKNGINKSKEDFGTGYPFINLMDVFGKPVISSLNLQLVKVNQNELESYDLKKGDVLFIRSSVKREGVGETSLLLSDLPNTVYSGFLIRFREYNDVLDLYFKKYCFSNKNFRQRLISLSSTSANTNINQESLNCLLLYFPSHPEQQKIAGFLTAVDEKIESLQKKVELLKKYKKGVMQKIFSQKIRFKDENGNAYPEWAEREIGDVFEEVNRKVGISKVNTYSITAGVGFVTQESKFGKDISGAQNKKYILLCENEFAYNKGNSKKYLYGCVYANKEGKPIAVPNVFICFKLKDSSMAVDYFENLFIHHYLDKELKKIISSSARMDGLLNVNKSDFFRIKISVPEKEEQEKNANYLSAIDNKINLEERRLEQAKLFKKSLLQQMFI